MRRRAVQLITAVAGLLLVSTLAVGLFANPTGPDSRVVEPTAAPAEPGPVHDTGAHDHGAHGNASSAFPAPETREGTVAAVSISHQHFRSGEPGHVPSRAQAAELPHQFESFTVRGDRGLARMDAQGHISGAGTLEDPYIIDGFRVREDLTIADTSKPIVIRNSYIEGQLTLNYNGPHVYVHHNHVFDLRVNENVDRRNDTTAGLFEHNGIEFIGQLRHFGGTFARNTVGPRPVGVVTQFLSDTGPRPLPEDIVWNFDGYHRGLVHNNTVDGRVDVKLHGHFHGTCNACPAHDHADPAGFPEGNERGDGLEPATEHSLRYHTLVFRDNRITVQETGVALRFYDENHAGDDRTANSEPNEYLEDKHDHHTFLDVRGNRLRGGSLTLDIVNALDQRHRDQVLEALVLLTGNQVAMDRPTSGMRAGYVVDSALWMDLRATGNTFTFAERESAMPAGYKWLTGDQAGETAGFYVRQLSTSSVLVTGTRGEGADYGIVLDQADHNVTWELRDNRFNADKEEVHRA